LLVFEDLFDGAQGIGQFGISGFVYGSHATAFDDLENLIAPMK